MLAQWDLFLTSKLQKCKVTHLPCKYLRWFATAVINILPTGPSHGFLWPVKTWSLVIKWLVEGNKMIIGTNPKKLSNRFHCEIKTTLKIQFQWTFIELLLKKKWLWNAPPINGVKVSSLSSGSMPCCSLWAENVTLFHQFSMIMESCVVCGRLVLKLRIFLESSG